MNPIKNVKMRGKINMKEWQKTDYGQSIYGNITKKPYSN
jgi:hypothetical protein